MIPAALKGTQSAMKKLFPYLKKEPMLPVAVLAAAVSLVITPPTKALLSAIDWRTLGTLFMMLTVLEGFKQENVFRPLLRLTGRISTMAGLSLFLVFGVFFSSMFVTNDVSLIVFVPITILLFRAANRERFLLPVISMENIAAVRGSLLTPFGSPQNLFIYGQSGVSALHFVRYMFPLWLLSGGLLVCFVLFLYRGRLRMKTDLRQTEIAGTWAPERRRQRIVYLCLFMLVLGVIVSRTRFWYVAVAIVAAAVLLTDRKLLLKTDYVLLVTFFCFFVFSSSVAANETVAAFLEKAMDGREYVGSILLSQVISNVPAAIVLYPFSKNIGALLYGLDSAGLVSLIGSLASVINYRIYVREYPGNGGKFVKTFTLVSLAFFAFVVIPGYLISRSGF